MSKNKYKEIVIQYMEKYSGQLSKHALAELLFEENKEVFHSKEQARTAVRNYSGNSGTKSRKYAENNRKHFFHSGEQEIKDLVYEIKDESVNMLILCDIHVPFQNNDALEKAIDYGNKNHIDTILLNGDTFDFYGESKFDKDPSKSRLESDYEKYNDFLFDLRNAFPDAKIYFKIGNHENRYYNVLKRNPQLAHLVNVPHFSFENVFNFDELGITKIEEYQTIKVGNKNIVHGHEVRGGGMFVARWLALRFFEDTICGHFHKTDRYTKKLIGTDRYLQFDSIGCLSQLHPRYLPYNEWNLGFGHLIKNGTETTFNNIRLSN